MKLTNPDYPADRRSRVKKDWHEVLRLLDAASLLHAVVCPVSPNLVDESSLFQYGPAILRTVKRFDHEVSCIPRFQIAAHQLYLAAKAVALGKQPEQLPRQYVYAGNPNAWQDAFRIEVNLGHPKNDPSKVRLARETMHQSASRMFARWTTAKETTTQHFHEERRAMGPAMLRAYIEHIRRLESGTFDPINSLNPVSIQMSYIRRGFEAGGIPPEETAERALEFPLTEQASSIPSNVIGAALAAYEARQVAGGMRTPKSSMWADLDFFATVLPYCDMVLAEGHFVEGIRQVRTLLPLEAQTARTFSTRNLSPFIEHMQSLVDAVSPAQRFAAMRYRQA